jgi:VIT1/CCC1 family predicted Fe2+/Mn2+ transporter
VHSQADSEAAELALERAELALDPIAERKELENIYVGRGLEPALARQVAEQLMARDAEGAHARDELGLTETNAARPLQAAFASAGSFAAGAALPLAISALVPLGALVPSVAGTALFFLGALGALSAYAGGAKVRPAAIRVTFWGALAMGLTAGAGALFGAVS